MNVLYVEDNASDFDLARRSLSRTAPEIALHSVSSLKGARSYLSAGSPCELVLIDLNLPDGSGLELITDLRDRAQPVAIVALTGTTAAETAVTALKAGADDFLVKRADYLGRLPAILHAAARRFRTEAARRGRALRVLHVVSSPEEAVSTLRHFAAHAPHLHLDAVSGAAALDLLTARPQGDVGPIDAVLLDQRVANLDALEMLKRVRDEHQLDLPVVLVTGDGDGELAAQALRLGADHYLAKHSGYLFVLPVLLEGACARARLAREQAALRESERALRDSEARFRVLFEQAAVGVAEVDTATGRFVRVNQTYCRIVGCVHSEVIGRDSQCMTHPDDLAAELAQMARLRSGVISEFSLEERYLRKDGGNVWVSLTVSPLSREGEPTAHHIAIVSDITERVRAQKEHGRLEAQLRQSQKMEAVGTLAGGIAHDFNNVLGVIYGNLDFARTSLPAGHPALEGLEDIQVASNRARDLVRQILAFSRRQEQSKGAVSLRNVTEETVKLLRAALPSMVELSTQLAVDLPDVMADATQVHQVVMNLCTNAWHSLGGRPGRIEVRLEGVTLNAAAASAVPGLQPGSYERLTVSDTGAGMDAATVERIFEPFFTTKPVGQGTGLGLSVVHGIMLDHGGAISVESRVREGTTFRLYFPVTVQVGGVTPSAAAS